MGFFCRGSFYLHIMKNPTKRVSLDASSTRYSPLAPWISFTYVISKSSLAYRLHKRCRRLCVFHSLPQSSSICD
ncbi:hypothetical protein OPV22_008456 [Ensete ventricosum]|uniref:Uncharacterized protein n=1 Tax=Ensete ventricosum TaxID=4639 RepID=A0AAV8PPR7_ENSVE|nr:hypothetical protein OPV22_008456 [Ensete ventricosum]